MLLYALLMLPLAKSAVYTHAVTTFPTYSRYNLLPGDQVLINSANSNTAVILEPWDGISVVYEESGIQYGPFTSSDSIFGFDSGQKSISITVTCTSTSKLSVASQIFMPNCTSHTVSALSPSRFVVAPRGADPDIEIKESIIACYTMFSTNYQNYKYYLSKAGSSNYLYMFANLSFYFSARSSGELSSNPGSTVSFQYVTGSVDSKSYMVIDVTENSLASFSPVHQTVSDFSSVTLLKDTGLSSFVPDKSPLSSGLAVFLYVLLVVVIIGLLIALWYLCIRGLLITYGIIKPKSDAVSDDVDESEPPLELRSRSLSNAGGGLHTASRSSVRVRPISRQFSTPSVFVPDRQLNMSPASIPPPRTQSRTSVYEVSPICPIEECAEPKNV